MHLYPMKAKTLQKEKHGDAEELVEDQFGWSREIGGCTGWVIEVGMIYAVQGLTVLRMLVFILRTLRIHWSV